MGRILGAAELNANADIEATDTLYGQIPISLGWAAEKGHIDVMKLLLTVNANIEAMDNTYGQTPLSWAAENGHVDVVKLLLNSNANIEAVLILFHVAGITQQMQISLEECVCCSTYTHL